MSHPVRDSIDEFCGTLWPPLKDVSPLQLARDDSISRFRVSWTYGPAIPQPRTSRITDPAIAG